MQLQKVLSTVVANTMSVLVMEVVQPQSPSIRKRSADSGYEECSVQPESSTSSSRKSLQDGGYGRKNYANCCDCSCVGELRCRDCMLMLCKTHAALHKTSNATSGHLIESEEERTKSASRCCTHEREALTGFCKTCQVTVCSHCPCYGSSVHQVVGVASAARERRQSLEELVGTTRTLALEELVSCTQKVASQKATVLSQRTDLQQSITSFYAQQMERLQEEQAMLLDQVSAVTNHNLETIAKQKDSLQAVLSSTTSSVEFTRCALSLSSDLEILAMHGPLSSRLYSVCSTSVHAGRLNSSIQPLPQFSTNQEPLRHFHELMSNTGLATLEYLEEEEEEEKENEDCFTAGPLPVHAAQGVTQLPPLLAHLSSSSATAASGRSTSDRSMNRYPAHKYSTYVKTTSLTSQSS